MNEPLATRVEVVYGDLLAQKDVDAIVNPANEQLHNDGGLALDIAQAAGSEFEADCRRLAPVPTGSAKVSGAGNLHPPLRGVINAVGPIWQGGNNDEARLLAATHSAIVHVASDDGLRRVALTAISTGLFKYPPEEAAPVAIRATLQALTKYPSVELVRFVMRKKDQPDKFPLYHSALTAALAGA